MATDTRLFYSIRSSTTFFVLTVGLGMLCDGFLYAFVVPLLPDFLEHRIHVPPQDVQKAISTTLAIYAFGASIGSPFAGLLADRLPNRSVPFLGGLLFLAVGTAMFMVVRTLPLLIFARILQGFSTAIVWTVGLAMLLDKVGAGRMGLTIGSIFGIMGVSQLAAPVLGGWLYEKAGTKALTGVALGIVTLDFLMRVSIIETTGTQLSQLDDSEGTDGSADSSPSDVPEPIPTRSTERSPLLREDSSDAKVRKYWYSLPESLPSYAAAFPILIIVQDPRFIGTQVVCFAQSFQYSAIDATLPPELTSRLGFHSGPISLMILPWIIPFMVFDPIFGRVIDRIGPKAPALAGLSSWAIVLLLMRVPILIIDRGNRSLGIAIWVVLLIFNGICAAASGSGGGISASSRVAEGYSKEHPELMTGKGGKPPYAQLFAVISIVWNCGMAAGPAAAGALRNYIGYANMNTVLAALQMATVVVCYVYMDGWPACGKGYEPKVIVDENSDVDIPVHAETSP